MINHYSVEMRCTAFIHAAHRQYGRLQFPSSPLVGKNDKDGKYLDDTYRPYQWVKTKEIIQIQYPVYALSLLC